MHKVVLRPQTMTMVDSLKGLTDETVTKRDQVSGAARLITIVPQQASVPLAERLQHDYKHDMHRYVQDSYRLLGLDLSELRLMPAATLINDDVAFFKYLVYRDDVRVEDAALLFRFKHGLLVQVVNYGFAEAQPQHTTAPLPDRELQSIMRRELGENNYLPLGTTWRVAVVDKEYVLVKVRHFRQEFGRNKAYVQINAHTGEIFELAPRFYYAAHGYARATVYPRWYRQELELSPLRQVGIELLNLAGEVVRRMSSDLEGRFAVPSQELTPRLNGINGAQIVIDNQSGPTINVNGVQNGGSWSTFIGRQQEAVVSNDRMVAQSMVYYHLQEIVQTASQYITSPWFSRALKANTNLVKTCNAHWDTLRGTVNFYSGDNRCANTGLIADVIYHEWGHGLDANTGGIVDGAFSEGFGDIVSMLMTRSHVIGPDFGLNGRSVRDLEPDRIHPQDVSGSVHSTGLIIGSTFWNLFKAFKEQYTEDEAIAILSRYAFQMIFTAERYTDVYDALLVIDDDDSNLSNGTPNLCVLNEVFQHHGLATANGECQLVSLVETRGIEQQGNGNGIIEPGETVSFNAWVKNTTARDFVNLRAQATADSEYVQWHNDTAVWQNLGAGNATSSDAPLSFTLDRATPCGESIVVNLAFELEEQQRQFSGVLQVGKHVGQAEEYNEGLSLPRAIADNSATEFPLTVQGGAWLPTTAVYAAKVKFTLFHFAHQELMVELVAPQGEAVKLFNGTPGFGILTVEKDVTELLRGQLGQGQWRLRVTDKKQGTAGYFVGFSLNLTPHTFTCQR